MEALGQGFLDCLLRWAPKLRSTWDPGRDGYKEDHMSTQEWHKIENNSSISAGCEIKPCHCLLGNTHHQDSHLVAGVMLLPMCSKRSVMKADLQHPRILWMVRSSNICTLVTDKTTMVHPKVKEECGYPVPANISQAFKLFNILVLFKVPTGIASNYHLKVYYLDRT